MTAELYAEQARAARAMLNWTQAELAERSGQTVKIIQRIEAKSGPLGTHKHEVVSGLLRAFVEAGIYFTTEHGPGVAMRGERYPDADSNLNLFANTPADYQMGRPLPWQDGQDFRFAFFVSTYLPDVLGSYADEMAQLDDPHDRECFRTVLSLIATAATYRTMSEMATDSFHRDLYGKEHDRLKSTAHNALTGKQNPLFDNIKAVRSKLDQGNGNRLPPSTMTENFRRSVATLFNCYLGALNPDPQMPVEHANIAGREIAAIATEAAGRGYISGRTVRNWGNDNAHMTQAERLHFQQKGRTQAVLYGAAEAREEIKAFARAHFATENPNFGLETPRPQETVGNITPQDQHIGQA